MRLCHVLPHKGQLGTRVTDSGHPGLHCQGRLQG